MPNCFGDEGISRATTERRSAASESFFKSPSVSLLSMRVSQIFFIQFHQVACELAQTLILGDVLARPRHKGFRNNLRRGLALHE
jgi:hypothetical protein